MIVKPMDVLEQFPIRKTKQQKLAFREAAVAYAREKGYAVTVEAGKRGVNNIVIGDPEKAEYLVTAHYDTAACIGIPNICSPCSPLRFGFSFLISMLFGAGCSAGAALLLQAGHILPGLFLLLLILSFLFLVRCGPANIHNANDNTSGVVTLLEIAESLPKLHRDKVCFVLFDLEERGMKGSTAYRKAHKTATEGQLVLNLDCVGDGDHILLMANKNARKRTDLVEKLKKLDGYYGSKQIVTIDSGFCHYNSDHKNFPLGVGIAAFHKKRRDYVLDKIHTKRDTVLEYTNVNLLRAALISLISQHN